MNATITVAFINGLEFGTALPEIFGPLRFEFDFKPSRDPMLCVSGPYGWEQPPKGAVHVGYLCENIQPDPTRFDWCFGTWTEDSVGLPRYTRIEWHGFNPANLVKSASPVERWLREKSRFCNFLYANRVPFRESFCRALAHYKPVDCPGASLHNMDPIDDGRPDADKYTRKRDFLRRYKFTIAFENSWAPGYHTEKILDPMMAGSIPIYWGDPLIARHFNPASFVDVQRLIAPPSRALYRLLRRCGVRTWRDCQPRRFSSASARLARKSHATAARAADALLRVRGWDAVVAEVRRLDRDDAAYAAMLAQPWLPGNRPPATNAMHQRWREILQRIAARCPR